MRRGRVFIYLALIVIIALAAAGLYFFKFRPGSQQPTTTPLTTPELRYVEIVTAGQNINPGVPITEAMLSSIQVPQDKVAVGLFTNKADVVGLFAKYSITQNVPITASMVSTNPGVNLPGSSWAPFIPQGLTAISIRIPRDNTFAYGIREGDYVNVIVTLLLVDVDPANQSILPNYTASVYAAGASAQGVSLAALITSGGPNAKVGRAESDETLGQQLYLVPSEDQRPRMVTQMIMQNIQVLHVGEFPLIDQTVSTAASSTSGVTPTPTPVPQQNASITSSDIITLMVTPQDAVMLTYLINCGDERVRITLTLRNPNDQNLAPQPDAATLEYLLTQYNIPVPAKLPYALQPPEAALPTPNNTTPSP